MVSSPQKRTRWGKNELGSSLGQVDPGSIDGSSSQPIWSYRPWDVINAC